jgi:hypothetical protein
MSLGFTAHKSSVFTDSSVAPRFSTPFLNDRIRADLQYPCCVPDTTRIEAHLDHLLLDVGQAPLIRWVKDEGLMGAVRGLAPIALFASIRLAAFDHLVTVTGGATNSNECHGFSPQMRGEAMAPIIVKVQI